MKKSIHYYVLASILFIDIILEDTSFKSNSSVTPYPPNLLKYLQCKQIDWISWHLRSAIMIMIKSVTLHPVSMLKFCSSITDLMLAW